MGKGKLKGRAAYRVAIQSFKELNGFLEESNDFLLRCVRGIAARLEGADTRSMFAPLVLPEAFVVALVVFPVCVHIA